MLVADRISQGYGRETVLKSLSLHLRPGVTALLGPNGAGKTTLLRTLATVQPPRTGKLTIAGKAVDSELAARAVRRQIGYLPQSFPYESGMRVCDFITYGAWLRGVPAGGRAVAVADALSYVDLSSEARTKMGKISGGMRQRAGIAWAVVGRPGLVLLDEPTVGLDPQQRLAFRDLLKGLAGATVLLSTHLTDDVDAACQRVLVLNEGELIFSGGTDELKALAAPAAVGHSSIEKAYMTLLSSTGETP